MTFGIEFTPQARDDFRQIREYISVDLCSETAASKAIEKIIESIARLKDFPEIGALLYYRVEIKTDYRYLVSGNYNVFYRIETDTVKIIRVLNSRRNFMAVLFGEEN
ncbi:MAG: type II toxin-antitoxin system RelE/ParE family toxin [Oscillospiraceae bacterium]